MASAASLAPGAFLLDRAALADGDVWRLWTGHLVHHTSAHFLFDVSVAVVLLLLVRRPWAWLALPPFVSAVVLIARPDLATYAGLSGVLHGLTVIACFTLLRRIGGWERFVAVAVLVGVCVKSAVETTLGISLFSGGFDMGAETIHAAHLAGVVGGLLFVLVRASLGLTGTQRCRPIDAGSHGT